MQENRNGKVTTYTYDALGQLIRVSDPDDPTAGESGTTWLYNCDRGGDILSKFCRRHTRGMSHAIQARSAVDRPSPKLAARTV